MPARLVREEDPRAPLKLVAPIDEEDVRKLVQAPAEPPSEGASREAVVVHALGLLTALAAILTARLVLLIATLGAIGLTAYAEYVHNVTALIASALYALLVLIPTVGLAVRKG